MDSDFNTRAEPCFLFVDIILEMWSQLTLNLTQCHLILVKISQSNQLCNESLWQI